MSCHILSTQLIFQRASLGRSPVLTQSHAAQNLKPEGAELIPTFIYLVFSVPAAPHKVSARGSFSVLVRQLSALWLQSGSCQLSRRGWCNHIHANTLAVIITAQKENNTESFHSFNLGTANHSTGGTLKCNRYTHCEVIIM